MDSESGWIINSAGEIIRQPQALTHKPHTDYSQQNTTQLDNDRRRALQTHDIHTPTPPATHASNAQKHEILVNTASGSIKSDVQDSSTQLEDGKRTKVPDHVNINTAQATNGRTRLRSASRSPRQRRRHISESSSHVQKTHSSQAAHVISSHESHRRKSGDGHRKGSHEKHSKVVHERLGKVSPPRHTSEGKPRPRVYDKSKTRRGLSESSAHVDATQNTATTESATTPHAVHSASADLGGASSRTTQKSLGSKNHGQHTSDDACDKSRSNGGGAGGTSPSTRQVQSAHTRSARSSTILKHNANTHASLRRHTADKAKGSTVGSMRDAEASAIDESVISAPKYQVKEGVGANMQDLQLLSSSTDRSKRMASPLRARTYSSNSELNLDSDEESDTTQCEVGDDLYEDVYEDTTLERCVEGVESNFHSKSISSLEIEEDIKVPLKPLRSEPLRITSRNGRDSHNLQEADAESPHGPGSYDDCLGNVDDKKRKSSGKVKAKKRHSSTHSNTKDGTENSNNTQNKKRGSSREALNVLGISEAIEPENVLSSHVISTAVPLPVNSAGKKITIPTDLPVMVCLKKRQVILKTTAEKMSNSQGRPDVSLYRYILLKRLFNANVKRIETVVDQTTQSMMINKKDMAKTSRWKEKNTEDTMATASGRQSKLNAREQEVDRSHHLELTRKQDTRRGMSYRYNQSAMGTKRVIRVPAGGLSQQARLSIKQQVA